MRNHLSGTKAYRVAWFVTREARSDVTVTFDEGRLIRVDSGQTADAIDLGEVALVDGLVNAHTHLEFSDFAQPLPMTGRFTDWIRTVISHRRDHSTNTPEAIRAGLNESRQAGTTRIGEISTLGWSWNDYLLNGFRGVIFQEALGLTAERITEPMALARKHVQSAEHRDLVGLSPHAPYSTHLELVDTCVRLCVENGRPLAMHLAETEAELELLSDRSGEFREMLTDFGLWSDDPSRFGRRPLDYLQRLALVPRSLVIHGNYLSDDELMFMAAHPGMTLVYCPRTHVAFGHSPHPWRRAIELGVPVALGTDSRASNPDLSLFAELQFLSRDQTDMSQLELLRLGSIAGRTALGNDKPDAVDFTLIRMNDHSTGNNEPHLFSSVNQVCGTMSNGQWAWLAEDFEGLIAS